MSGAPHATTGRKAIKVPHVTTENQNNSASTLPLRGLAMVLIAVAVLLGLWALYSFTQDNGSNQAANTVVSPTPRATSQSAATNGQNSQTTQNAQSSEQSAQNPAQNSAQTLTPNNQNAENTNQQAAPAAGEVKLVNVLNNSTIPGYAAQKSKDIAAAGYQLGQVGNFSADVLTETTVFYPAGDAAAEASARQLASTVGGVAKENIPDLPQSVTAQRSLTVVLVNG